LAATRNPQDYGGSDDETEWIEDSLCFATPLCRNSDCRMCANFHHAAGFRRGPTATTLTRWFRIDGNFYGTTYSGGANGYGTIFKITHSGTLTTLHSFTDGSNLAPTLNALRRAGASQHGDFYGTTFWGGADGDGTVCKITPAVR
jgi:uncharacterized repeat protein (TIGR03803 family)